MNRRRYQQGAANAWVVVAIVAIMLFIGAASAAVWAYASYTEQRNDVESRIKLAEAKAAKDQQEKDQKEFDEREKNPRAEFVGPAEYGRLSFRYPKTWSVYIEKDGRNRGDYVAYLHKDYIAPANDQTNRYMLRVEILNQDYAAVLKNYESKIKSGDLRSSSPEYNGIPSTRIDGAFDKELRGSVVLMQVRDKTIRLSTDAESFRPDFDEILGTVSFME